MLELVHGRLIIAFINLTSPDLSALEANVENDVYSTMDMFIKDAQKIFDNCRTYNAETTSYAKCANRLERYFKERVKVWCNNE